MSFKVCLLILFLIPIGRFATAGEELPYPRIERVVDLVAPFSTKLSSCPEVPLAHWREPGKCLLSGIVEAIRIEPGLTGSARDFSKVVVRIGGDDFIYPLQDTRIGEAGAPIALFTTSKLNGTPVTVRFHNWRGTFYITDVRF